MIEAKPENLIGDRAYDSDPLDKALHEEGIEMISPHRIGRKRPRTQDGRKLRRYERRWLVERFFAWLQWQRRLVQGVPARCAWCHRDTRGYRTWPEAVRARRSVASGGRVT
jgi:transposase